MSEELDSGSFNKNYRVLKETADWLSGQKEPDIDQLVPKVERAMKSYAICKERLEKVQATLGEYFQQDQSANAEKPDESGLRISRRPSSPSPIEEDSPF